jgi:SOS response regulatory protein OraA/RecX
MGSDQQVQVHETALRWLARREYAENELIRKLSQRLGDEIEDPHLIRTLSKR